MMRREGAKNAVRGATCAWRRLLYNRQNSCYTTGMDITQYKDADDYASQAATGALLNPRIDSTFKALFTQPTPESRAALHAFLEAATERKIATCRLVPNDAPTEFAGQRGVSYDIACEFDDGLSANIEMQAFNQAYDYGKRAEYQVSRLETTYLKKGDNWEKAPTVYQITVLDFNYTPKTGSTEPSPAFSETSALEAAPVSRYAMRTKDGRELANALNIIFIELPKAAGLEAQVEQNSPIENWALFLKDADNPQKQDVIHKLTEKEAGEFMRSINSESSRSERLMQAQKSLSNISANRDLWLAQYRQEVKERDYRSGLAAARAEGITQGIAQGERNKALETARNFLRMGLPFDQVASGVGLSIADVQKLATEL